MCGIGGIFDFNQKEPSLLELNAMAKALAHRGPDGEGLFQDGNLGIVHRRLSVLDISENAKQPIQDPNSGSVLSFNGEIYNYQELAKKFHLYGKSRSDSEVLLLGLVRFGLDFLLEVDGDFAFAFWEPKIKTLHLARDRFGVKPLYYSLENGRLVFASEIKALFAASVTKRINHDAIADYFRFRYVKGTSTLFAGVKRLAPAHTLSFTHTGRITEKKFWEIKLSSPLSQNDFIDSFEATLSESVSMRLRSDVPVGATVSGGLDSAMVLAMMKAGTSASFDIVNYEMPEKSSELRHAMDLARHYSCRLHVVRDSEAAYSELSNNLWHLEEPLGDAIISPTNHLYRECRKSMTVCLSGEGADEILGGYAHHRALGFLDHRVARLTPFMRKSLAGLVDFIPMELINRINPYPAKLSADSRNRIGQAIRYSRFPESYLSLSSLFSEQEIHALLHPDLSRLEKMPTSLPKGLFFESVQADLSSWLPNYGLLRVDKLSMAHGLEVRVPYLSHHLVNLVLSNLYSPFDHRDGKKNSLRVLGHRIGLPASIMKRKKQPFFVPLNSPGSTAQLDLISEERIKSFGWLDWNYVDALKKSPNNFITAKKLQSIATFQVWAERFFDS